MKYAGLLRIAVCAAVCALVVNVGSRVTAVDRQTQTEVASQDASAQRVLLDQYCITCHNSRVRTAGLALDAKEMDLSAVGSKAAVWEKVVAKLNAGAMPPPGGPRPTVERRTALVSWLETELDRAAAAHPNAGRPGTFHRLNRTEYQNAIRDLLALDIDVSAWLPGDTPTYGFDNNADVLSMSPSLFDGYLSAAAKIAGLAIGDLSMSPDLSIYKFSELFLQQGRTSDDLPFGAAGGEAVRHYFPLDGEYVVDVGLEGGPAGTEQVELRLDGVRIGTIGSAAGSLPVAHDGRRFACRTVPEDSLQRHGRLACGQRGICQGPAGARGSVSGVLSLGQQREKPRRTQLPACRWIRNRRPILPNGRGGHGLAATCFRVPAGFAERRRTHVPRQFCARSCAERIDDRSFERTSTRCWASTARRARRALASTPASRRGSSVSWSIRTSSIGLRRIRRAWAPGSAYRAE